MAEHTLDVTDQPASADVRVVHDGLNAHNEPFSGPYEPRPLAVFVRGVDGRVRGGVVAETAGDTLKIDMLWVEEDLRGHGWGHRLLVAAEREAVVRGCRRATLDTASFQAPAFYQRHGYREVGRDVGFHGPHDLLYLVKDLDPTAM